MSTTDPEASEVASFRDPAGRLIRTGDRVFRLLNRMGAAEATDVLAAKPLRVLMDAGRVVGTRVLSENEATTLRNENEAVANLWAAVDVQLVLEHDRVEFPSYAHEWPPEMLAAAGRLTLDLAEELLPEGLGLKDASPANVLFRGSSPVFIDLASIERRDPHDPVWLPYAQFLRTFVLPLLVHQRFGIQLSQLFLARRDGTEPSEVYRLCSGPQKLIPPFLGLASIPTWLGKGKKAAEPKLYQPRRVDPEKAAFILRHLLRRLRKTLERVTPRSAGKSGWSGYMDSLAHYQDDGFQHKTDVVDADLQRLRPGRVLDIGCNTGRFSIAAAQAGARVVALDSDPAVVGELWRATSERGLDVLPLVGDIARPTPAVGWRNSEELGFLARATGSFDMVLMLAVVHHLMVTERIPLTEIVGLAASLTTDAAIIEYVGPEDPMFRKLARGRDALHADLTPDTFEASFQARFDIEARHILTGTGRRLYLLRKRA